MEGRSVVALPFKVAVGFLCLIFLWGFVGEEMSMSNPVKYEYEHTKKDHTGEITSESTHGSLMPWKSNARDRHMHLDTDHIHVGERVELVSLSSRPDLNGVTGRVMEFDGKIYTVRLVHGIGRYRLKRENIKLFATKSSSHSVNSSDISSTSSSSSSSLLNNNQYHDGVLIHHNNASESLDRIEMLISPQHSHVDEKHYHQTHGNYNQSNYNERLILLFLILVLFCGYVYQQIPKQQTPTLSIKCPPPSIPQDYIFVDDDDDSEDDEESKKEFDQIEHNDKEALNPIEQVVVEANAKQDHVAVDDGPESCVSQDGLVEVVIT